MDRALWFVGPRQVELRPVELPRLDGPATPWCGPVAPGISAGTEMLAYRGELPADLEVDETIGALGGTFTYPFRYGYSCVGRVEALGPDVENLRSAIWCSPSTHTRSGSSSSAANSSRSPALEPRSATLLPYVETALQVTLDAGPVLGETVVVSGLGALGLLVSLLVERAGGRVVAIEPQAWRRAVAPRSGTVRGRSRARSRRSSAASDGVRSRSSAPATRRRSRSRSSCSPTRARCWSPPGTARVL